MKENVVYTVSMIPSDVITLTFTSKKDYQKMKVNCASFIMKPFRIFLAKNDPSSTNTIKSNPIFINGYSFLIEKGDENYFNKYLKSIAWRGNEYLKTMIQYLKYDKTSSKYVIEDDGQNCIGYMEVCDKDKNENLLE